MSPRRALSTALVALVIAVGVFFRFYHLEEKLLWHDEVATRVFAAGYTVDEWKAELLTAEIFDVSEVTKYQRRSGRTSIARTTFGLAKDDPQHPPVYYVSAALWEAVVGDSIADLRALSALFGVLALPAMFWLVRELNGSKRTAWIAVTLLAASPFFVLYAQEAREYALWTLLILVTSAALLQAIRLTEATPGKLRLLGIWAPYFLATTISLYTSFSTMAVVFAHSGYLLSRARPRIDRVLVSATIALIASGLCFLPWALNLIREYAAFEVSMRWSKEIIIPRTALMRMLMLNTSRTMVDFWPDAVSPLSFAVMGAAALLAFASIVHLLRREPRTTSLLVLLIIFVPLGLLLGPDLLWGGIRSISMRYLTPAWVALEISLAFFLGAVTTPTWTRIREAALVSVAGIGIASCWSNSQIVAVWTKALSVHLPDVAREVNSSGSALVVGDLERYNPAQMLALSLLLKPGTRMQFLHSTEEAVYQLPRDRGDVYLFTPINEYRTALEQREGVTSKMLLRDDFLELWRIEK